MPVVIQCIAEEGDGNNNWALQGLTFNFLVSQRCCLHFFVDPKQQHITIAIVEKNSDSTYTLKALKQKQFVDGLCYLLQEIYGIENKNAEYSKVC